MGCCSCFGFTRKHKELSRPTPVFNNHLSQELLLGEDIEDDEDYPSDNDDIPNTGHTDDDDDGAQGQAKHSEEILMLRAQNELISREFPVKETHTVFRTEDENGNKMINEYVHECKIGSGSYGKVAYLGFWESYFELSKDLLKSTFPVEKLKALYRSQIDGKHYAIKAFHKSHLLKLRVAPKETAMTDVLREVLIMKMLNHPNIVNLVEVIDDPNTDHFYMVLEYVEGKWVSEGSGPTGLGETTARNYLRDIVSGLKYLHSHNVVHGDIKPDNLLVTSTGTVKIGDFSVSQVFEDDNDVLRRSPGTPVFTAPECCLGVTYRSKAADTWAVGVTLYYMAMGKHPFLGDTLQDTYDKIVNNSLCLPDDINPQLKDLLEGLLCKDPDLRLTLDAVSEHTWVVG